jgi:hypothetical protein
MKARSWVWRLIPMGILKKIRGVLCCCNETWPDIHICNVSRTV